MRIRSTKGEGDVGIKQRLARLEEEIGVKHESGVTIITINPNKNAHEDPYTVELFPDLWAYANRGGPFTPEEIRQLRKEKKSTWEEWQIQLGRVERKNA